MGGDWGSDLDEKETAREEARGEGGRSSFFSCIFFIYLFIF